MGSWDTNWSTVRQLAIVVDNPLRAHLDELQPNGLVIAHRTLMNYDYIYRVSCHFMLFVKMPVFLKGRYKWNYRLIGNSYSKPGTNCLN